MIDPAFIAFLLVFSPDKNDHCPMKNSNPRQSDRSNTLGVEIKSTPTLAEAVTPAIVRGGSSFQLRGVEMNLRIFCTDGPVADCEKPQVSARHTILDASSSDGSRPWGVS